MKRTWNWSLWVGFLVVLTGFFSYLFFVRFPSTRDFPWANLLLFFIGFGLLVHGCVRAFGRPKQFRGRVMGPIFVGLGVLVFAFFAYGVVYLVRILPASAGAPKVGQTAPAFTVTDVDGKAVTLADLLGSSQATLLIFYRGHW